MKKDTVRKIAAALFFLCGLLNAYDYVRGGSREFYGVIPAMGKILFACAVAALGVCAWLDKKTGFKIAALAAAAADFVPITLDLFYFANIGIIIPDAAVFLSCLIFFFAASAKKDPFIPSFVSAICMAASEILHFLFYPLPIFRSILTLSLALSILFWGISQRGISQRKPKMPVLAAGAAPGAAVSALEKLNELRQSGDITEEEFNTQKAELLKKL